MSQLIDEFLIYAGTRGVLVIVITPFESTTHVAIAVDPNNINLKDMLMGHSFQGPQYGLTGDDEMAVVWSKEYEGPKPEAPLGFVELAVDDIQGQPTPSVSWRREQT